MREPVGEKGKTGGKDGELEESSSSSLFLLSSFFETDSLPDPSYLFGQRRRLGLLFLLPCGRGGSGGSGSRGPGGTRGRGIVPGRLGLASVGRCRRRRGRRGHHVLVLVCSSVGLGSSSRFRRGLVGCCCCCEVRRVGEGSSCLLLLRLRGRCCWCGLLQGGSGSGGGRGSLLCSFRRRGGSGGDVLWEGGVGSGGRRSSGRSGGRRRSGGLRRSEPRRRPASCCCWRCCSRYPTPGVVLRSCACRRALGARRHRARRVGRREMKRPSLFFSSSMREEKKERRRSKSSDLLGRHFFFSNPPTTSLFLIFQAVVVYTCFKLKYKMQLAVGCFVNTRRGKREGGRKEEISSFQPVSVWFSFEEKNLKKKPNTARPSKEREKSEEKNQSGA